MATNHSLKEVCEDKGYHFLDNNPRFMVNGIPDSPLYRESIHLNPKGGKLLGTNIRQKLNSILNLSENNIESEAVPSDTQQSDFHRGRPQGGETIQEQGNGLHANAIPSTAVVHESVPAPTQQQSNEPRLQQAGTTTLITDS